MAHTDQKHDFTQSSKLVEEDYLDDDEMRQWGRERKWAAANPNESRPRMNDAQLHSLSQLGLRKWEEIKKPGEVMYDWQQLEEMALEAIEKYNLVFTKEVAAYIPAAYMTAIKKGFFKLESIQEALNRNRVHSKVRMRNNWQDPDAAAQLQLSAYKLMADEEERQKLGSYHKGEYSSKQSIQINVNFDAEAIDLHSDPIDITPEPELLADGTEEEE